MNRREDGEYTNEQNDNISRNGICTGRDFLFILPSDY
jgi:hypothetical protein